MLARFAAAIGLGTLVTLAVLFAMQALITAPRGRLDESGSRHFVDFVRVEREETTQRKERRREKPEQPEMPPPDVTPRRVDSVEPSEFTVDVPAPAVDVEVGIEGLRLGASDSDYLPIVKIEPPYPMAARSRGIEGFCLVEYTVTAAGTVKDVVVIDSRPKGIFDSGSIKAALKFKYRPRVINGEPIEVRGVRNLFRYELK